MPNTFELTCLVLGQSPSSAFKIEIDGADTIADLKEKLKQKVFNQSDPSDTIDSNISVFRLLDAGTHLTSQPSSSSYHKDQEGNESIVTLLDPLSISVLNALDLIESERVAHSAAVITLLEDRCSWISPKYTSAPVESVFNNPYQPSDPDIQVLVTKSASSSSSLAPIVNSGLPSYNELNEVQSPLQPTNTFLRLTPNPVFSKSGKAATGSPKPPPQPMKFLETISPASRQDNIAQSEPEHITKSPPPVLSIDISEARPSGVTDDTWMATPIGEPTEKVVASGPIEPLELDLMFAKDGERPKQDTKARKKRLGLRLLIVVVTTIVVIGVAVGMYMGIQLTKSQRSPAPSSSTPSTPAPTPTSPDGAKAFQLQLNDGSKYCFSAIGPSIEPCMFAPNVTTTSPQVFTSVNGTWGPLWQSLHTQTCLSFSPAAGIQMDTCNKRDRFQAIIYNGTVAPAINHSRCLNKALQAQ